MSTDTTDFINHIPMVCNAHGYKLMHDTIQIQICNVYNPINTVTVKTRSAQPPLH